MCGKGIHRVEVDENDKTRCYMDYFCSIDFCGGMSGKFNGPLCPHNGKSPCTCEPEEDES